MVKQEEGESEATARRRNASASSAVVVVTTAIIIVGVRVLCRVVVSADEGRRAATRYDVRGRICCEASPI